MTNGEKRLILTWTITYIYIILFVETILNTLLKKVNMARTTIKEATWEISFI